MLQSIWKSLTLSPFWPLCLILALLVVYGILVVWYRLTRHPLAGIPGPRVAAVTNLYGAYYDLIRDGSLCRQVGTLHEVYGPIVRIAPNEIHVRDLESYYEIFRVGTTFDKKWDFYNSRAIEGSLLNILDTPTAKRRRDAYLRYFSRDAISKLEPRIHATTDHFLALLQNAARESSPVDLSMGFRCLTADVIVDYAYGEDFGGLRTKNFMHPAIAAGDTLLIYAQWAIYFRKIFYTLDVFCDWLPDKVLKVLSPQVLAMRNFKLTCARSMHNLKRSEETTYSTRPTIFDTLLDPAANRGHPVPSDAVLTSEAVLMLLAGTDTTANTLTVATYATLCNPQTRQRLLVELKEAMPTQKDVDTVTTQKLRSLPYLGACFQEALRLSYGAPGRLPRVVPASGITVCNTFIPPDTTISHSNYVYHMDKSVFDRADEFIPERWLHHDVLELERRQLAFARGSRSCLGMHLATAEFLITFAKVFRTLNMSLWNTTPWDMEWRDYSVALFRGHLRVMIDPESKVATG